MKPIFFSLLMLGTLFTMKSFSQSYEATPCGCCGNPNIKNLLKGGRLTEFYVHECGVGGANSLSSSFLKPSGSEPKDPTKDPAYKPSDDPDEAMGMAEDFAMARDKWTCMYAGSMLKDGDIKTAWVEGVKGNGAGELIIVPHINASKKIEIHNGFGKSESLYKANSRPKTIKVHILKVIPKDGGAAQCGTWYDSVELLKSQTVTLQDVNKFQPLTVPAFKREKYKRDNSEYEYSYWLMIEIVDVYSGLKYQDTCISEIRNAG